MNRFKDLSMMAVAPALLFIGAPEAASAGADPGIGNAVLKVGAAVLVSGVFLYNHFRDRIRGFIGRLVSRG
jgi:hypothetical protein